MAHYAFLDENNVVTEVIAGRNEDEVVNGISDWEEWYGNFRGQKCLRTSYNGNIRGQFAKIGYVYDPELDVFIDPSEEDSLIFGQGDPGSVPYPSVPYPEDDSKIWVWSEQESAWVEFNSPE